MNRTRPLTTATISDVPRRKDKIPKDLRVSLTRAVEALCAKFGDERIAAARVGMSQGSLNRIKQGEQEPGALFVSALARELRWSADRVLGLPERAMVGELAPALVEAITFGRHSGPAIAAASRMTMALDAEGWRRVLERLDQAVEEVQRPASHVRPAR